MRMIRKTTIAATLTATVAALVAARAAGAQDEFPMTLYWDTGLIDIPAAWVAPISGDFTLNYSGKRFTTDPNDQKLDYSKNLNSQLTFSLAFAGRVELGVAAFSSNPEEGLFAKGLLIREDDFRERGGFARWIIPSIGIGVRNIGRYDEIDRFGIGYELIPPFAQGNDTPNARHRPDAAHRDFKTTNSLYGVATKSFNLAEIRPNFPDLSFSVTAGYGNGLFNDDGGLKDRGIVYSQHDRGGLFYGVKSDFSAGPNLILTVMFEDNSWDYNAGLSLAYRGLRAGLAFTELGAGSRAEVAALPGTATADDSARAISASLYNYQKTVFTLGWQSNVFALLRGEFLQNKAAALERQREGLLAEITARQQRIAALELEINRYEAQNLLELEQRRQQAEAELRAEREQLRRLEERLQQLERQNPTRPPQQRR